MPCGQSIRSVATQLGVDFSDFIVQPKVVVNPPVQVRKGNSWLYSLPGLAATYAALRRGGVLAIWSAGSQPPFVRRLRRAGFEVDEVKVRARGGSSRKGGADHVVWIATRG